MKGALYVSAIVMVIAWLVGVIFFRAGMLIHILAITAAIAWMQGIILRPKVQKEKLIVDQPLNH